METFYYIVLVPMVYLAFGVFIFGTIFRIAALLRAPRHPVSLRVYPEKKTRWLGVLYDSFLLPTVRKHNPVLWIFLMFFHIAFLLLIIGHLELIKAFGLFQLIPHDIFLGGGYIGIILAVALLFFLLRRLVSPNRELSVPEDYYLLILLFLTVIFGSEMHLARRWFDYGSLGVSDYRDYLYSLVVFKPELPATLSVAGHSFMLVLHILFANIFLMLFPFSKIMHAFISLPINNLRRK